MSRKILILSILATALIILLPISSVVGTNVNKNKIENKVANSPLFSVKVGSITEQNNKKICTNYLGKGTVFNIFLTERSPLNNWIGQAIKIINNRPFILSRTVEKIENLPQLSKLMDHYDISIKDFEEHMLLMKNDPNLLEKQINEAVQILGENILNPIGDPEPLGFSGQPGCLIAFFIILPIIIMIGTMIATFTIITCLNINGCFETIMQNIFEGFAQGVILP